MELASRSACNQKHGAVIVVGGRTIGLGANSSRNSPDCVPDPKTQAAVHAEIAALKACGRSRVAGGTIYVARVGKNRQPMMSRPCVNCQKALKKAGIKKIVYTISSEMTL